MYKCPKQEVACLGQVVSTTHLAEEWGLQVEQNAPCRQEATQVWEAAHLRLGQPVLPSGGSHRSHIKRPALPYFRDNDKVGEK